MMLLMNPNYVHPSTEAGAATQQATARRIAQWAVNVVDFCDSDACMTPFEYDWNPF